MLAPEPWLEPAGKERATSGDTNGAGKGSGKANSNRTTPEKGIDDTRFLEEPQIVTEAINA